MMSPKQEQLLAIIGQLAGKLRDTTKIQRELPSKKLTSGNFNAARATATKHCAWMLGRILEFVRDERTDKANRWIGFIQGALWATGQASIDEFREMNKKGRSE